MNSIKDIAIAVCLLFLIGCTETKEQVEKEVSVNDEPVSTSSQNLEETVDTTVQIDVSFEDLDINDLELIQVGPDRLYKNLAEALRAKSENVYIVIDEGVYANEGEAWVRGTNIIVEGKGKVEFHCTELYNNVMWISGENIIIRNLHLKHFVPGYQVGQNCSGRVIGLDMSKNVLIENCDINGCGLVGVHDNLGNSNIIIKENYIHYNSLAPFGNIDGDIWMEEVPDHPTFTFINNRIENNGPDRVPEMDTLDYSTFSEIQALELDTLLLNWNQTERNRCFGKFGVEPNCSDCPSVSLVLYIDVNTFGYVESVSVVNNRIFCLNEEDKELLTEEIMSSIEENWFFSEYFSGMQFKVRVGVVLKC